MLLLHLLRSFRKLLSPSMQLCLSCKRLPELSAARPCIAFVRFHSKLGTVGRQDTCLAQAVVSEIWRPLISALSVWILKC